MTGESPRSNSITVPALIDEVHGLLTEIVVEPPVVKTPVILVLG